MPATETLDSFAIADAAAVFGGGGGGERRRRCAGGDGRAAWADEGCGCATCVWCVSCTIYRSARGRHIDRQRVRVPGGVAPLRHPHRPASAALAPTGPAQAPLSSYLYRMLSLSPSIPARVTREAFSGDKEWKRDPVF
jgi:hypothetical protein